MLICQDILCRREFAPKNSQHLYCTKKCQENFHHREYRKRFKKGAKMYRFLERKHPAILVKIENMMERDRIKTKELN